MDDAASRAQGTARRASCSTTARKRDPAKVRRSSPTPPIGGRALASDRTYLAAERTYAAWMRTALAALASGVGARALMHDILPDWIGKVSGSLLVIFAMASA